ncbi:uncharacterized protein LOC113501384 [Trichoplusia ni]|uniref:Uncharacterized protein LOC113501384 n=1 Tax=Trichoplusia ni TaxID=7111 RepID=A0A7E5WD10_TRINI|nr:uncharacterized protein LOC113501384 [Trichoplusia ni]
MVLSDFLTETRRRWLKFWLDYVLSSKLGGHCCHVTLSANLTVAYIKLITCIIDTINTRVKFLVVNNFSHVFPCDFDSKINYYFCLQAFNQLFKRNKSRKSTRNRISPELVRSPSYSGTVDARADIDVTHFCACRASLPPLHIADAYENTSYYSSYNSYNSSRIDSLESYGTNESNSGRSDSAYDSARSSPEHNRVCYATVTYFNVNDSEDSSSIRTEYTLLDDAEADRLQELDDLADLADSGRADEDERTQNMINESIELVSTL